jgi:hypothetical protein
MFLNKVGIFTIVMLSLKGYAQQNSSEENSVPLNQPSVNKKESRTSANEDNSQTQSKQSEKTLESNFMLNKKKSMYQNNQKNPTKEQQKSMDEAINELEILAPQSFEYHLYKYIAGNHNVNLASHLLEAKRMQAKNPELQVQLTAYYFINGDKKSLIETLKLLKENGKIESDLVRYAKHLLSSVKKNGTLITHGFDDTYAILFLQHIESYREDVTVISMDFLQSDFYKNKLLDKGYALPKSELINADFIAQLVKKNKEKTLSLSLSIPKNYFEAIQEEFEIIGLTASISKHNINPSIENNRIYQEILLSKEAFIYQNEKAKKMSANYLPMLLLLKKEFQEKNENKKVLEIDEVIQKIGLQAKKDILLKELNK